MLWGRVIGRGGGLHRLSCNYYIEFLIFKALGSHQHERYVIAFSYDSERSSWSPHSLFGCPVAFSANCRRRLQTPSAVLLVSEYSFNFKSFSAIRISFFSVLATASNGPKQIFARTHIAGIPFA